MSNINVIIDGLGNIDKMINNLKSKNDIELNKYLKNKVKNTYVEVMNQQLTGGTTNDEYIALYKKSYHIEDTKDGFILYNNSLIPQSDVNSKNKSSYPKGFSIAMAFEYGVGIVGISTGNPNAWEYNKHNYESGWFYPSEYVTKGIINKKKFAKSYEFTSGYVGFEIFRKTVDRVNQNLGDWVKEYYTKGRV